MHASVKSQKNEKIENCSKNCFTRTPLKIKNILEIKYSLILLLCLMIFKSEQVFGKVRKVPVSGDQIVTVKTAIGIATIIQVPDRPNSVVVGDQESFKVEYLDQAITIKPLHSGAKSNLYVYTDWKRYNVQLTTGTEAIADYVVYLESPKTASSRSPTTTWRSFANSLRNESLALETRKVGTPRENLVAIEFVVSSSKKEKFDPSWIWLTQNGQTKVIHNLYVSNLNLEPQTKVNGVIQILKSDISFNEPLRIELRRKRLSYLTIPKVDSWIQMKVAR